MKTRALQKALPTVAGLITDRTQVPVMTARAACTDGSTIYLPPLPLDLAERDFIRAIAYVYHESAHILETDFSVRAQRPIQKAIANILEDVRIEKRITTRFPGAKRYLARLVEIYVEDGLTGQAHAFRPVPGDGSAKQSEVLQAYMLYKLRYEVLGQTALAPLLQTAEAAAAAFPKGMRTRLDALMFEVENCATTADVLFLTDEIISMIEEEEEKERQHRAQGQQSSAGAGSDSSQSSREGDDEAGQSSGPSDPSQGQDEGQQDPRGSADDGTQAAGSAIAGEDQNDLKPQSGSGADSCADNSAGDPSAAASSLLDMSEEELLESLDQMLEHSLNATSHRARQSGRVVRMPNLHALRLPNKAADTSRIAASINAIRVKTLAWMSSIAECDTHPVHAGTQLDYGRLYQAKFGGAVFVRSDEGIDLNSDVSILIDRSGSMAASIQLAAEAALATLLAFDIPGISTQVSVFPVSGYANGERDEDGIAVIKGWEESPSRLGGRIQALSVEGSTPMAEAILWAACDLLRRDPARRILLVVTDGDPDDHAGAVGIIEQARASGIEVLGLGIRSNTEPVFGAEYAAAIWDIGELAQAMVKLIKSAIR